MSAQIHRCWSRLCCPSTAVLMLFSACQSSPSQTPDKTKPYTFETALYSGPGVAARITGSWRISDALSFTGETEAVEHASVSQAFLNFQAGAWTIQAGRQRIGLGDERLLGFNRDFAGISPGWDGIRARRNRGLVSGEAILLKSRLHNASILGGVLTLQPDDNTTIEPYWLTKRQGGEVNARGFRAAGIVRNLNYNIEMIHEGKGNWAGHWEIGRVVGCGSGSLEYNYATPGFDEFFPAALNAYGTEDPFPWIDTRNVALNWKQTITSKLQAGFSYRAYWDAAGVYESQHAVAGASYQTDHWRLSAGCGRLIAVHHADAPAWTPYVSLSYNF